MGHDQKSLKLQICTVTGIFLLLLLASGCGHGAQQSESTTNGPTAQSDGGNQAPTPTGTALPTNELPPAADAGDGEALFGSNIPSAQLVNLTQFATAPGFIAGAPGTQCFIQYGGHAEPVDAGGIDLKYTRTPLWRNAGGVDYGECPEGAIFRVLRSVFDEWVARTPQVDEAYKTQYAAVKALSPSLTSGQGGTALVNRTLLQAVRVLNLDRFWSECLIEESGKFTQIGTLMGGPLVLYNVANSSGIGYCPSGTLYVDDVAQTTQLPILR